MSVAILVQDDEIIIYNVFECDLCGGEVDRFCYNAPDPHFIYQTKYFQCRKCAALGDPMLGIMCPPRRKRW